jgi:DNA-binding HxlR family transcriptional regulator
MLGRQATFARAARPPRSARRSVQFSAVARRRRMFPRQPPASAPASCTREPMTVFKALADRHRVKILNRLLAANGEAVCVCDFEAMLDLKQPTVSYHLKELLNAGIVTRE